MKAWYAILLLALAPGCGCTSVESMFDKDAEKEVALSEVPQAALDAAKTAVPGILLTEAEVETEDGQKLYTVEGTANGKEYEIEVTADGKVIEVEADDQDQDDDDNDKEEDDDEEEDDD